MSGYLEIILGPMFSGKTTKLINIYKKNEFCNIPVLVINYKDDNRYSDDMLSTHDKIMIPCIKTDKLFNLINDKVINIDDYKVILINEGQFFPDLIEFVKHLLNNKKSIYVCGLDGDFEQKKFGNILDLIPLCNDVYKLHSLCYNCKNGNNGDFTKRISNEKEQVIIGSDNYVPVCRKCISN